MHIQLTVLNHFVALPTLPKLFPSIWAVFAHNTQIKCLSILIIIRCFCIRVQKQKKNCANQTENRFQGLCSNDEKGKINERKMNTKQWVTRVHQVKKEDETNKIDCMKHHCEIQKFRLLLTLYVIVYSDLLGNCLS